jgi:hypothetical protein
VSSFCCMCPHTAIYVYVLILLCICVLILLYICVLILLYICVLILRCMCPQTPLASSTTMRRSCIWKASAWKLTACFTGTKVQILTLACVPDAARELYNNAKELYMEGIGVEADCVEAIFNLGLCCRHMARLEYMQGIKKKISSLPALLVQKYTY